MCFRWSKTGGMLLLLGLLWSGCHTPGQEESGSETETIPMSGNPGAPETDLGPEEEIQEYLGTFSGVLPCSDCEGRKTDVALKNQMSFIKTESCYKNGKAMNPVSCTGTYRWNPVDQLITLELNQKQEYYFFQENNLIRLDSLGNLITGTLADRYVLSR